MSLEISTETTFLLDMTNAEQLGAELYTQSNAVADSGGTEANATTNWNDTNLTGTGSNIFQSQAGTVQSGSYAFEANSNDTPTADARAYLDLNAILSNGIEYRMIFYSRHVGSGDDWGVFLGATNNEKSNKLKDLTSADTSFIQTSHDFTYSVSFRYLVLHEDSVPSSGGVYFDNLSIKQIL